MSTLHIVSTSVFKTDALKRAVSLALPGDAILLIEDGVYAAADTATRQRVLDTIAAGVTVHALSEDLAARALPAPVATIATVSYAGFVDLVCLHRNSVSWS